MNEIAICGALDALVNVMREELQEYGEILACFDDLENIERHGTFHEGFAKAVQNLAALIQESRRSHVEIERRLVRDLGLPAGAGLGQISNLLPDHYQLLVKALMEENEKLPLRIEQRAAQYEQLLASPHPEQPSVLKTPVFGGTGLTALVE